MVFAAALGLGLSAPRAFAADSSPLVKCIPWKALSERESSQADDAAVEAQQTPLEGRDEPFFPLNPDTQCVIYSDIYAKFRMNILKEKSRDGIIASIASVRDCLKSKGFYTPPSAFLFWTTNPGGTSRGDGFHEALRACNQQVVSGPIQINTMTASELIKILEDPKRCIDLQQKLAFPSASIQGIGTVIAFQGGTQLQLRHAMTLLNVVCPPNRPQVQFRDPDTGKVIKLSIHPVNAKGDKVLMGTLKGVAEYSNVEVQLGLTEVDWISK